MVTIWWCAAGLIRYAFLKPGETTSQHWLAVGKSKERAKNSDVLKIHFGQFLEGDKLFKNQADAASAFQSFIDSRESRNSMLLGQTSL